MKSAAQSGSKLVLADENVEPLLKDSNTIAYYNPGGLKEDKQLRAIATKNSVITFS